MFKNIFSPWFTVDARVLAIFRICLGALGFWDVARRFHLIDVFYSTAGINLSTVKHSIYTTRYFSLLNTFSSPIEATLLFIITAIASISLIIGYRTKLSHFIVLLGIISIHNFRIILENGGDMAFNAFLVWSFFLPLGKSLSIDALIKSLKRTTELNTDDLNINKRKTIPFVSHFAYFGFIAQLGIIYFYNFVNKTGDMWTKGTSVFYMYQLDTFLTNFGLWFGSVLNPFIISLLTHTTIWIELLALLLIFSPIYTHWTRRIAFVSFFCFHLLIGISVSIGLFSWVMMSALILLLGWEDIVIIRDWLKKVNNKEYIVFYDRDCGFCFFTARILKRLDIYNRIYWADDRYPHEAPENFKGILENSIIVYDEDNKHFFTRHIAFSKILSILPFGYFVSWILRIPILEKLWGWIYDVISTNRTSISQFMGLPACGLPNDDNGRNVKSSIQSPLSNFGDGFMKVFSNSMAVILFIGVVNYSLSANDGLKKRVSFSIQTIHSVSPQLNKSLKRMVLYPRMSQKWNMFAPTVMTTERWVVADIEFFNGDTLSLFINNDEIYNKLDKDYMVHRNQFWRKLFSRINKSGNRKYIDDVIKWLRKTDHFPEYEGRRPKDITLWQISERSPSFGSTKVSKVYKRELKPQNTSKSKGNKSGRKPKRKN
jgi:predicted DCC family thiol-disulfide oxidoreductase YuxK